MEAERLPVTVGQVLQLEPLAGTRVLASSAGVGGVIEHADITEVPDTHA